MSSVFPRLSRPQYPSSPEVLLSALAWSTVPRAADFQNVGLIYARRHGTAATRVTINQTKPREAELFEFCGALMEAGVKDRRGELSQSTAEAIANSLEGTPSSKGVGFASSAVGIAGALLQDPVGGLATKNPPPFALLINTIYHLGGGNSEATASELWFHAARYHATSSPLCKLEQALAQSVLVPYLASKEGWPPLEPIQASVARPGAAPEWWNAEVLEGNVPTPFSWFRASWDRLCSKDWYERLPPRRWASWAMCLLRHGLAFTFLWEANFYFEIARGIADPESDPSLVAKYALVPVRPLIPYRTGTVSQMDVQPTFKKMLEIGLGCRNALHEISKEFGIAECQSLPSLVETFRSTLTPTHKSQISAALSGAGDLGGIPNLLETVRYSLLARESEGAADNYSLLRNVSRRYYHVSPGAEWIVVMSAMSAPSGPNSTVRLGDLTQSLKGLGFQPRTDFLLGELERAGLCVSAPDGDEGIEINLGFGGN